MAKKHSPSADGGFLQDILANPDDDTPRLVYADWLDEQGDAARAEFIRAGCELARLGEEAAASLRQRARELLGEHRKVWVSGLPAWVRPQPHWFRRGFPAGVFVTAGGFLKGGKGLVARAPLESLSLRQTHGRLRDLATCAALAGLLELGLEDPLIGVDLEALHVLLSSPHLGRLRILRLRSTCLTGRGADRLALAPRFANLTELHLVGTVLGDEGLGRLAASPFSKTCAVLRMVHSEITAAGAAALAAFSRLAELDLSFNALGAGGAAALATALSGVSLRRLVLRYTRPGREGLAAIARSPGMRRLGWLNLDGSDLGDDALEALASPDLARLTHLDLYNNRLTDRGVELLAGMPNLASLTALDIGLSDVSDAGATALARSPWLKRLSCLGVGNTAVGPAGRAVLQERFGPGLQLELTEPGGGGFYTNLPGAIS